MSKNMLQRGVDPYADADITNERTGAIGPVLISTSAAAILDLPNLFKGRVRDAILVVNTTSTVAAAAIDIIANGQTLATITVPIGATKGTVLRAAIADSDNNFVNQLDAIRVDSDGAATAGDAYIVVRVSADDESS